MKMCPKCNRSMEEGFVVDAADGSMPTVAAWHRGQPLKKWWGLKTSKADRIEIASWRCIGCGLLEHYAR